MTQKNANILSNTDDLLSTHQLSGRIKASQTYLFAESRHFFIQTIRWDIPPRLPLPAIPGPGGILLGPANMTSEELIWSQSPHVQ